MPFIFCHHIFKKVITIIDVLIMLKITTDNYHFYKRTFEIIWNHYAILSNLDPHTPYSPIKVLENWETKSNSLARRGLKVGLNDLLPQISSLPKNNKIDIDNELKSAGLQPLGILISSIKKIPEKVLKNGKLKNLEEYYIIKEVISDMTYELSETDREKLDVIVYDFENNQNKKNSR
jgi:hypothetical protein